MADNTVDVKFGGDSGEAQKAIADVTKALQDGVGNMQGSLSTLAEGFAKFSGILAGFTAILAGGALFKDAISSTLELNGEIAALSKKMGISSDDAVNLSISLKLVGASTESYTHASSMLDRQLRTNEEGLQQMGIVTRSANGEFAKQPEIMKSAFDALMQYKEGTDRNMASMAMFGRGADEIAKLMKVNGDITAEATRLQKAWGIEVNGEGIAATKAYKVAMAETGIAMEAMSDALGKTILPMFVQLGEWFKGPGVDAVAGFISIIEAFGETFSIAGTAIIDFLATCRDCFGEISSLMGTTFEGDAEKSMGIFTRAVKTLNVALLALVGAFETVCAAITMLFQQLANRIELLSKVLAVKIGPGMWDEIKESWKEGCDKSEQIVTTMLNKIGAIADETAAKMLAVTGAKVGSSEDSDADNATGAKAAGGNKTFDNSKDDKGKDKAEPDKRFQEWKNMLEQQKEAEGNFFKNSQAEEEAFWIEKLAQVQGGGEKEKAIRRAVEHELYAIHKAQAVQLRALDDEEIAAKKDKATYEVEVKKESLKTQLELGQINAQQELAGEKTLTDQQYQIDREALNQKILLYQEDTLAVAKFQEQKLQLERKYAVEIQKINSDLLKTQKQNIDNMLAPITSAITQSVTGMIQGTTTMAKALNNLFKSILASFVQLIAQMVVKWAAGEMMKTVLTQKGSALRTLLEKVGVIDVAATTVTANATSTASTVAASDAQVVATAPVAAAKAAGSVASYPYVGAAMAVAAFAAVMAMILGSRGHAVGSWNVPGDMITKIHKGEMIVPEQFASSVRDGGGLGGGGDVHLHVNAVDGASVSRMFKDNAPAIAEVLRRHARNFTPQRA